MYPDHNKGLQDTEELEVFQSVSMCNVTSQIRHLVCAVKSLYLIYISYVLNIVLMKECTVL